jgi:hypothetical protein
MNKRPDLRMMMPKSIERNYDEKLQYDGGGYWTEPGGEYGPSRRAHEPIRRTLLRWTFFDESQWLPQPALRLQQVRIQKPELLAPILE